MQGELNEFECNKVLRLFLTAQSASVIGLKWVFWNKLDNEVNVIRNKSYLIFKGYCQEEIIKY